MGVKIIHEIDKCIGCGACAAVCSEHWEMGNDGKSILKNAKKIDENTSVLELEESGCNMPAAQSCPVNCIHIEKDGKKEI